MLRVSIKSNIVKIVVTFNETGWDEAFAIPESDFDRYHPELEELFLMLECEMSPTLKYKTLAYDIRDYLLYQEY